MLSKETSTTREAPCVSMKAISVEVTLDARIIIGYRDRHKRKLHSIEAITLK